MGSSELDEIILGDAATILADFPTGSIDLIVTSPPYWNAVVYETESEHSTGSYQDYLDALMVVWRECARVLRPNGKLAINTPIMPVPKAIIGDQHTRHLKNINNDIEAGLLAETDLLRYSLFVWQKQTSKLMFGSYPFPGNLLENNTIEFINVMVKPGKPPKVATDRKEADRLTRDEWLDLTQQIWFMYPEDVGRRAGHPAPFPIKLPARLIRLYTFRNEVVLDPFCGSGTTCLAARRMGRRYVGIDISRRYVEMARRRLTEESNEVMSSLMVGRPRYPTQDEINRETAVANPGGEQHKRRTYGRNIHDGEDLFCF